MGNLTYLTILVAVDGSIQSEWAVQKGIEIAKRNHAKLYIVYVLEQRAYINENTSAQKQVEEQAHLILESHKQKAMELGVDSVETILEYGTPKHDIAKKIAPKLNADVIVCGKTGETNPIEHLFLGSVSEGILKHAKCDVLIVKSEKKI